MGLFGDLVKLPFSVLDDTVGVISEGELKPKKTLRNIDDIVDDLI